MNNKLINIIEQIDFKKLSNIISSKLGTGYDIFVNLTKLFQHAEDIQPENANQTIEHNGPTGVVNTSDIIKEEDLSYLVQNNNNNNNSTIKKLMADPYPVFAPNDSLLIDSVPGTKGNKGPTGDPGDPGMNGTKGNTGGVGSKGDTGETGDPGAPGQSGSKGDIGPKGPLINTSKSYFVMTSDDGFGGSAYSFGYTISSNPIPLVMDNYNVTSNSQYSARNIELIDPGSPPFINIILENKAGTTKNFNMWIFMNGATVDGSSADIVTQIYDNTKNIDSVNTLLNWTTTISNKSSYQLIGQNSITYFSGINPITYFVPYIRLPSQSTIQVFVKSTYGANVAFYQSVYSIILIEI